MHIPSTGSSNSERKEVKSKSGCLDGGLYVGTLCRFVSLGFAHDEKYDKVNFKANFGFEILTDMAGNPVSKFVTTFEDDSTLEQPRCVFSEYNLSNRIYSLSKLYPFLKATTDLKETKVKDKTFIDVAGFPYESLFGKPVMLQLDKVTSQQGNEYNKIVNFIPTTAEIAGEVEPVFFNLYDPDLQEVWNDKLYGYEKEKISNRYQLPQGEPGVVYGEEDTSTPEAPSEPPVTSTPSNGGGLVV